MRVTERVRQAWQLLLNRPDEEREHATEHLAQRYAWSEVEADTTALKHASLVRGDTRAHPDGMRTTTNRATKEDELVGRGHCGFDPCRCGQGPHPRECLAKRRGDRHQVEWAAGRGMDGSHRLTTSRLASSCAMARTQRSIAALEQQGGHSHVQSAASSASPAWVGLKLYCQRSTSIGCGMCRRSSICFH
jgi:hypothetical protein